MAPEVALWVTQLIPEPAQMRQVEGVRVAFSGDIAATYDLHTLDSGLVLDSDQTTSVLVELLAEVHGEPDLAIAAVALAANELRRVAGMVAAQPGVLLPGVFKDLGTSVEHGMLIAPQRWSGNIPRLALEGSEIYLLELIGLTDDEYEIAREQGPAVLERRLRRRGTDVRDWRREG